LLHDDDDDDDILYTKHFNKIKPADDDYNHHIKNWLF
jgi:hypothetical protein